MCHTQNFIPSPSSSLHMDWHWYCIFQLKMQTSGASLSQWSWNGMFPWLVEVRGWLETLPQWVLHLLIQSQHLNYLSTCWKFALPFEPLLLHLLLLSLHLLWPILRLTFMVWTHCIMILKNCDMARVPHLATTLSPLLGCPESQKHFLAGP